MSSRSISKIIKLSTECTWFKIGRWNGCVKALYDRYQTPYGNVEYKLAQQLKDYRFKNELYWVAGGVDAFMRHASELCSNFNFRNIEMIRKQPMNKESEEDFKEESGTKDEIQKQCYKEKLDVLSKKINLKSLDEKTVKQLIKADEKGRHDSDFANQNILVLLGLRILRILQVKDILEKTFVSYDNVEEVLKSLGYSFPRYMSKKNDIDRGDREWSENLMKYETNNYWVTDNRLTETDDGSQILDF
ncbi:hypothetical protein BDK51DRAFT_34319 [Blyttiomyces helicus]|uniref:Uncharacterized protein n=1 Tax=Blyttiomyces helicus TaxID=388810 RepID=A0A4P9VU77_9FUNG|nr:hypothetical protein BDK51DRAFT_34319 [Blyttiomyces helicus]|eukprot:RKO83124.1 hypothetical protein BDK51DRAFT_34319 [Blyttiomyces helicus]